MNEMTGLDLAVALLSPFIGWALGIIGEGLANPNIREAI